MSAPGIGLGHALDPAAYAGTGGPPRAAVRPSSREELREVLKSTSGDRLRVIPFGGPPSPERAAELPAYDLAIDLSALDRVVEYEPEDLTLTAECGATLAALRATVEARGQELPIESLGGPLVTLGGALAENAAGPRRLRFGAPRDRILGARFVLADGTLARTGGRVVKNVAGYGIHRLLCGSRGGLAILIEASLKLAPAPAARVALAWRDPDPARLEDAGSAAGLARLEPAVVWLEGGAGGPSRLTVGLEDDRPWVERQAAAVASLLGPASERRDADDARRQIDALASFEPLAAAHAVLFLVTPDRRPRAASALTLPGVTRFAFDALAGRCRVEVECDLAAAAGAALAERGFELVESHGVAVTPDRPRQARVLELRSRIRGALDPARRFALGDRWES